jgi:hypothetical protein
MGEQHSVGQKRSIYAASGPGLEPGSYGAAAPRTAQVPGAA